MIDPELIILYINDICKVTDLLKVIIFADDTNIFCSEKQLTEHLFAFERESEILKCWIDVNK